MLKSVKADYQIILILGIISLYHIILQDRGAYSWPDEHLYNDALKSVAALLQMDLPLFCKSLTGFGARPAEATLRLVPAMIQTLLERWQGISPYNPESLRIAASFNVISSFLLSFVFYRLSQWFYDNDKLAAILATGIYALLVSSNVFVRHIIPYDTALMFCLLALYLVLKANVGENVKPETRRSLLVIGITGLGLVLYPLSFLVSRRMALLGAIFALVCVVGALVVAVAEQPRAVTQQWVIAGIIAGLGLAVYPAYYSFPCAVLIIALLRRRNAPYIGLSWAGIYSAQLYGLSLLSVVFFWEVIARVGGESYLGCAYRLSKTITQGEFSEGYVFLAKYFIEVEGLIGGILLILGGGWFVVILERLRRPESLTRSEAALTLCCAVWASLYLVYATQSAILHKMTFTGRYARMYFPFVVYAAIETLRRIPLPKWRAIAYLGTAGISLFTFFSYAAQYKNLAYPVNVLYDNRIRWEDIVSENKIWETHRLAQEWIVTMPSKGVTGEVDYVTAPSDKRFVLVNFSFIDLDAKPIANYEHPAAAQVVYQAPHFLTFPSSRFEAWDIAQRENLKKRNYQVSICKLPDLQ